MSWISGFADKAEQLLIKIDQNAADKLQKKKTVKPLEETRLTEVTTDPSPVLRRHKLTPPPTPVKKSLPLVKSAPVMVNQSQEEDKLIEFLNDNSKPATQTDGNKTDNAVEDNSQGQLEAEKQMLKNEVRVLNNELSLLLHRTRAAEKEAETLKAELSNAETVRLNLQDEMKAVMSQLSSLQHQHHTLVADKRQLEEQRETVTGEQVQVLQEQIRQLQDQNNSLTESLQAQERQCGRVESARQQQQLECDSLTQQLTQLRAELDQYRARAQRTLNDKEALISQLRASNSDASVESSFQTELAQLREERQVLLAEHQETCVQLQATRSRLVEVEHTLEQVREAAAHTQQELQDRVAHETHRRRIIEDDYRTQSQELRQVQEEWNVVRGQLTAKLRERETELNQLRGQLSARPASPPSLLPAGELEGRLSSLTRTLIQKQTALESATTERNQLRMQLEELEHKHREHLLLLHQARVISANDTDDAKAQVPSFMVESPFDTGVARRVKRAYSSLDAVSIRTGVFLRRYPLARILVIFYVILLHLLVLLVLCSRTPDNAQK
ncbi:golgin-84-like [Homalodisca vitripennis]|uniref:golgin-84-like n=1 Tax=Homalodisca vitripennis TaxID=197043 RepID=UPI001EEBB716|nr:golgin-84-like [Homalodisca vitripennis]XP_046670691.1 golgin-84-like [Homalodisca vitripennis]